LRRQRAAQGGAGPETGQQAFACARSEIAWLKSGLLALVCTGAGAAAGCSGQSSFLTGGPTVGQLKTSLSHLEFENQQLKRSLAKLQQENRSIEDRLVQEQLDNGDLAARLDDARNLLGDRGLASDFRARSSRGGDSFRDSAREDEGSAPRTLRAGQRSRQRRKPPFARITGSLNSIPSADDDEADPNARGDAREREAGRPGR
jgi:hypothetical protein